MNLVEGRIREKSHISISLNADVSVIWLLSRGDFSQTKFKEVRMREIFAGIVRDRGRVEGKSEENLEMGTLMCAGAATHPSTHSVSI